MATNPRVNFKVVDNNPLVEFYKNGDTNPMFKMTNESNEFKLKKWTGSRSEDVMTVNEDGVIVFPKNVEFRGTMTSINSSTLTFQDQQVDLGLTETSELDVSAVSEATVGSNFRYTFKLRDSNKSIPFAVNDYVLIQNLVDNNTPTSNALLDLVALPVKAVDNSSATKTFTIESSVAITVANIKNTDNVIASKLSAFDSKSGVRMFGLNGDSLVQGALQFNNLNNMILENNSGSITIGGNNVNKDVNIATAGARTISIGSTSATSLSATASSMSLTTNSNTSETITLTNTLGTSESAIKLASSAGGVDIDASAGKDLDLSGGQVKLSSKDNANSAISLITNVGSSETIVVTNTQGTSESAIQLASSAGGVDVDAAAGKDLDLAGGQVKLSSKDNVASAISLTTNVGSTETIDVTNTQGTSESAIKLKSSVGGVNIDAAAGKDVDVSGGQVKLSSKDNANGAIKLTTNVGILETIEITNTQGTSASAIQLNASRGGVDIDADKDVDIAGDHVKLSSKNNSVDAISLITNIGTNETIIVKNTQGTSESAIKLESTAGGITLDGSVGKDVSVTGGQVKLSSKDDVTDAISLTTNIGSTETITITNSQGTNETAIKLASSVGGVDIDAAAGKDLDLSGGQVKLSSKDNANSAISLITNVGSSETIYVNNTLGTSESAIHLNASAGGVNINAATNKDVSVSGGQVTLLSKDNVASAISLTTDVGTTETIVITNTQGTDETAIKLASLAGGVDIDAAAGKDVDVSGGQVKLSSKDNVASAISLTTNVGSTETIVITNTQGTSESAIKLESSAGGINIDASVNKDLNVTGGQVKLSSKDNANGAISLTTNIGSTETIIVTNTQGTDETAIKLASLAGGVDIDAATGKDVDVSGGQVKLSSKDNANGAISLTANVGADETIIVTNTQGTSESAIQLVSTAGGVDIDASAGKDVDVSGGQVKLSSKDNANGAISLTTNVGTDETILVTNTQGTSESAIKLESSAGGVNIDAAAGKDVDVAGGQVKLSSKDNVASAISLTTNIGSNETIVITNTQGTSTSAIQLNSTVGGIKVNSHKDVSIESSDGAIYIGNDTVNNSINIGTHGERTITLGSTDVTSVTAYNFTVASDATLKTNIMPLTSTLDKVLQLDGYKYNWKNSANESTQIGLIAQEVEQFFPELITQHSTYKSVNYLGMVAVLVHAMKEQQEEIERIRSKLN